MSVTAIVLAAGEGTRMKSSRPKVVHEVLGRPMVRWVVEAAREAGADRIVVVVGNGADQVRSLFSDDPAVECVLQEERLGTGHAVRCALEQACVEEGQVLALLADRAPGPEVVLTGRDAPPALVEQSEYCTEMCCRKHPFERGVPARKGIEF